jgi:predicted nuclease with TOPRIM domain
MKENNNLKNQLEDTKTTLALNKELLFKYISSQADMGESSSLITELKDENTRLTEKLNTIYNEKTNLEKKVKAY